MKFSTIFNVAALATAAVALPTKPTLETRGNFESDIYYKFREASDVLSEKACDLALTEASHFADFFAFAPFQGAQELLTAWFQIFDSTPEFRNHPDFDVVKQKFELARDLRNFSIQHPKGFVPGEFVASNYYLRCRSLHPQFGTVGAVDRPAVEAAPVA
ncbi:hypothetical protein TWF694_002904 [Orbilia ellipsospora]|uniref:Uncharacterized protein n=1 Tax=Orbilia ellipsospora TaxID=2528407 RepID=A0AAV9X0X8_9PEZI